MAKSGKLTPKKRAFARALLTARDVRSAAAEAGITERTAYRWHRLPEVRAAVREYESDAVDALARELVNLAEEALATLRGVLNDSSASDNVRVRSADIVLRRLLDLRELVEFEERLSKLEEILSDGQRKD